MQGRVLIVDDDQSLCETMEAALRRAGFQASWKSSADEALSTLDHQDFDVVVTDLNMRGMNGLALCERTSRAEGEARLASARRRKVEGVMGFEASTHDQGHLPGRLA